MRVSRLVMLGSASAFVSIALTSASCAGGGGGFVDLSDAAALLGDGGPSQPSPTQPTQPSQPSFPGACASNQKLCAGACVSSNDPKYGCASASCTPCRSSGAELSPLCVRGECAYQNCTRGADCDGDPGNGCETLTWADPNNCGGCNIRCSFASGKGTCSNSKCVDNGCQGGWSDCNGNTADGCEVQTGGSDAKNCGACGRVCTTGVCTEGLCEGELVTRTQTYSSPVAITVADGSLYYATRSNSTTLRKIAKVSPAGGTPTELMTENAGYVVDLAVDGGEIFAADHGNAQGEGRIYKLPTTGTCTPPGCPTVFAAGRNFPAGLAVDATYVYWIETGYFQQDNGGFYRKRKDNTGTIETLGSFTKFPQHLVFDRTGGAFFIGLDLGQLERVSLDGTTHTPVVDEGGKPLGGGMFSLALGGDRLFYSNPTLASGEIISIPKAGGTRTRVGDLPAAAIVPDGNMLYALGQPPSERMVVFSIPTSGVCSPASPCPVRLAKYSYDAHNNSVRPLAVDATHVYWIENLQLAGDGAIRKVPK